MNSERLMAKAQRALEAATRAAQAGDTETAADRVYYSVYYAAWALLDSSGSPRPKTHRGLIAEFSRLFVKDGPLDTASGAVLSRLENLRLVADCRAGSRHRCAAGADGGRSVHRDRPGSIGITPVAWTGCYRSRNP